MWACGVKRMDQQSKPDAQAKQTEHAVGSNRNQFDNYLKPSPSTSDGASTTRADEASLRQWATNPDPQMRRIAIDRLLKTARIGWDDMEKWLLDEDSETRALVLDSMWHGPLKSLCETDKRRSVKLLFNVAHQFQDYYVGRILLRFSTESAWLDEIWPQVENMIDQGDPILMTMFICTFLEQILPEHAWTPQDPHLRSWVSGDNTLRQYALLKTAAWLSMSNGQMKDLVQALTESSDSVIAENARALLDGKLQYGDF